MNTLKIRKLAFVMLAALSLASCSNEEDNEDKVEQVTIYVSEETGLRAHFVYDSVCPQFLHDILFLHIIQVIKVTIMYHIKH